MSSMHEVYFRILLELQKYYLNASMYNFIFAFELLNKDKLIQKHSDVSEHNVKKEVGTQSCLYCQSICTRFMIAARLFV